MQGSDQPPDRFVVIRAKRFGALQRRLRHDAASLLNAGQGPGLCRWRGRRRARRPARRAPGAAPAARRSRGALGRGAGVRRLAPAPPARRRGRGPGPRQADGRRPGAALCPAISLHPDPLPRPARPRLAPRRRGATGAAPRSGGPAERGAAPPCREPNRARPRSRHRQRDGRKAQERKPSRHERTGPASHGGRARAGNWHERTDRGARLHERNRPRHGRNRRTPSRRCWTRARTNPTSLPRRRP
jgi:hypothetical protein